MYVINEILSTENIYYNWDYVLVGGVWYVRNGGLVKLLFFEDLD